MPRPCRICALPRAAKLNEALLRGDSPSKISHAYGVPLSALLSHKKHSGSVLKVKPSEAPPAGSTPQEQAVWHMKRIEERMKAAEAASPPNEKAIAALYGQYTNAMRHHAKVSGALDITEAQVVRSQPFTRVMGIVLAALEKHPAALKLVGSAVQSFVEGK